VRCDQATGTIKLIERNGGTETERSSAAQTFNTGTAYRIVAIQEGMTIKTYVGTSNRNSYTSATFNQGETGVTISNVNNAANLACWPRTATLPEV
jgi:hypothetical protein